MPRYQVNEKGFYKNMLYDPEGKRRVLYTDKPLDPVPSWVTPIKDEAPDEKKVRIETEKKETAAAKRKAKQDRQDVEDLTFMGAGEKAGAVETL